MQSRPTILVVEDEMLVRVMLADALRDAGYEAVEAVDGDEAIRLLGGCDKISVVVSDVRMPGSLDGIALAKRVRSERPEIKIVLVSGDLTAVDGAEHDGVFRKPYDVSRLIALVDKLVPAHPCH
jgi:CheY-like chemotaxis protein